MNFIEYLSILIRPGAGSRNAPQKIRFGDYKQKLAKTISVAFNHGRPMQGVDWYWKDCSGAFEFDPEQEPNPHVLIVGMSGYGKSTLCKSLILEICKSGKKMMVFDAHNEHTDAIKRVGGEVRNALYVGINLLALDGVSVSERISDLVELFTEVYHLGNVQAMVLRDCLLYTYRKFGAYGSAVVLDKTPTIGDLVDEFAIFMRHAKSAADRNTLRSVVGKLTQLNTVAFNKNFIALEDLKSSVSSFSLAKLKSREARAIYINELLKRLYLSMKENEREKGVKYYIMIDEAQFLIGSGTLAGDLIRRLVEEGRKYGVGLIIATHSASNLDRQIVANASTFLSFYSRETEEVEYVANLLGGGSRDVTEKVKLAMMGLNQHEALVMKKGFDAPVIVRTFSAKEVQDQIGNSSFDEEEKKSEKAEKVIAFAQRPVTEETLLGNFGNGCVALAEELVVAGKLEKLSFVENGVQEVWYTARLPGRPSIEHEVCVRKISNALTRRNVKNTITSHGPNPDIIAYSRGRKIAVEYETGSKSNWLAEVAEMIRRRSEYYCVAMFVNDNHIEKYRKSFQSERVKVMSMGELEPFVGSLAIEAEPNINKQEGTSSVEGEDEQTSSYAKAD